MQQRWYDKDPTLSMAISLLHNADESHQEMAARYMFKLMEAQGLLEHMELCTKSERVRFMFPSFKRSGFEMHARHLVELFKHLEPQTQLKMAVQLIHYIYILDGGFSELVLSEAQMEAELFNVEHESGMR